MEKYRIKKDVISLRGIGIERDLKGLDFPITGYYSSGWVQITVPPNTEDKELFKELSDETYDIPQFLIEKIEEEIEDLGKFRAIPIDDAIGIVVTHKKKENKWYHKLFKLFSYER